MRPLTGRQSGHRQAVLHRDGNVALGDAQLWQATPNKRSDLLFLKPAVRNGRTNMMVVTDRRRYAFDLMARDDAACRAAGEIFRCWNTIRRIGSTA